jgi:hypothetical protein
MEMRPTEIDRLSLFLLGAGFNIDATREAGPMYGDSIYVGRYQIDCSYPLVGDVLKLCFGLDKLPAGKTVENLFAEHLQAGNYKPMETLVDRLMEADYRIASKLALSRSSNSYKKFFESFNGAQFLTFNYDSLAEIFLSQDGSWQPEDGYAVPVLTELAYGAKRPPNANSRSVVIHLHGSACVYTVQSEIVGTPGAGVAQLVRRPEPLYAFDADSISHCFPHYRRVMSPTGCVRTEERVIAPVPDKREGLKEAFICESYTKALQLVRQARSLIAVGYSFSPYDRASYDPVLQTLAHSGVGDLMIVSPQAGELARRLSTEYAGIRVQPVEKSFGKWATDEFSAP